MRRRTTGALLALLLTSGAPAFADDPVLAPGRDPGGVALAVLADGFDYTQADVAKTLARDGEGEAIAWDAVDGDHRPFVRDGGGTDLAKVAAAHGGVRLVAVRVAAGDPASLAQGVAFSAGTPARVVLVPLAADARGGLDVVLAAAPRFEALLFVASVAGPTADETTRAAALGNLVLLDAAGNARVAPEAVARALGCDRGGLLGSTGAELKTAFLDRLKEEPAACGDAKHDAEDQQR